ncbi:hypothetical protein ACFQ07_19655, partial [Actinomadura adrarensis]
MIGSLRRSAHLLPAWKLVLLSLTVTLIAAGQAIGNWDDLAQDKREIHELVPMPEPPPDPQAGVLGTGSSDGVWHAVSPMVSLSSVVVTDWNLVVGGLVVAACGIAALFAVRRRSYGMAALFCALPLLLHTLSVSNTLLVNHTLVGTYGAAVEWPWTEQVEFALTTPFGDSTAVLAELTMLAFLAGAVSAVVLALRARRERQPGDGRTEVSRL